MNRLPNETTSRSKGFPLGAFFLLIAVFAAIAAQLSLLRDGGASAEEITGMAFAGAIWGPIAGLMIGLHDLRRQRGALVGIVTGFFVGTMAGPIAISSMNQPLPTFTLAAVSGIGLVSIAALYRMVNSNDPVSKR